MTHTLDLQTRDLVASALDDVHRCAAFGETNTEYPPPPWA